MNDIDKPEIINAKVTFTQDGNTLGTTSEMEEIEIKLEFQLSEKDGPFYVIKTDGWSFENIGELQELLERTTSLLRKDSK